MARGTKTVATPVAVVVESNTPSQIDNAAIERIDMTPDGIATFMARLGGNLTTAGVWQNYATGFWHLGRMARANKLNTVPDDIIVHGFNAYRNAKAKVSKAMEDSTAATYLSAARGVAEAARICDVDTTHIVEYLQKDIGSLQWGSRGGRAMDVVKAFATIEPKNREEIQKRFPAAETVGNLMDEAVKVRDGVAKWLTDGVKVKDTIAARQDLVDAFNALNNAAIAMVTACSAAGIQPTPKKRGAKDISDAAKAILSGNAIAPTPTPTPTTH